MYKLFSILLIFLATLSFTYAEMKCAPGKCGGGKCGSAMKIQGDKKVYKGNTARKAIDIVPRTYHCAECNMFVNDLDYAAELVEADGTTYFFDDIGCLVRWMQKHPSKNAVAFVKSLDTHRWINAKKAWYTRTDSTPMRYGFGAHEMKRKGLISFEKMKHLMLLGQTLRDPAVKKSLLQP